MSLPQRKKPEILAARTIAQTRHFRVEEMDLRFSNGVSVRWERLIGSPDGAVLVVPLRDADTVLLIREYAAGMQRYELGFAKGRIENGEAPIVAANRELMEEVGFAARRLSHLHSLTIAPGYVSHVTHIVVAQDLYPQRQRGDEPEEIEVVPWRLDEIDALVAHPEFTEARSMAALFIVRDKLRSGAL